MKRIAIISPSLLPIPAIYGGAVESLIQNFIDENELQRRVNLDVVTIYDQTAAKVSKDYAETRFLWIKKDTISILSWNILRVFNIIKRFFNSSQIGITFEGYMLQKILKNNDYDAVIVEGNGDHLHYLKNIVSPDKLYFHIHSFHYCSSTERNKYLMSIPHKIISVSQFIAKSLNENLNIPYENIVVVKNCISSHFYSTKKVEREPLIDKNKISIVFTGRIVKEKGILELLDALYLIRDSKWKLNIIGSFGSDFGMQDGKKNNSTISFQEEVINKISGFGDCVVLSGYIENNKIPEIYPHFDFAVMPSICNEAAPLVIGEFMAAGLPVVASNLGGIPEYLPNEAGIVVPYDENFVQKLAESIKLLIENKELRVQMSKIVKDISKNYMPLRYYSEIIEVFN